MAKVKYRYNPETLSYDVITTSVKENLKRFAISFIASIVIAVIYFAVYSYYYDTPKERILTNNLSEIKFNYHILFQDLNDIDKNLSEIQKRDDNIYRTVLESDPIPNSIRQAGFGGINRYESFKGYHNSELMITAAKHTDKILKQLYVQSLSYDELIEKLINKEQIMSSRPAILPIANKDLRNSTSRYGWRLHPIRKEWHFHPAIDLGARSGTPIRATGDGKVVRSEYNNNGYGWVIVIDHGIANYLTLYAHMLRKGAEVDTEVKRGQVIGLVGSTGSSTSPHVHYEVHKNVYGNRVNPINYFYSGMTHNEYVDFVEQSENSEDIFEEWSDEFIDLDINIDMNSGSDLIIDIDVENEDSELVNSE